jgi:hypothetical protein
VSHFRGALQFRGSVITSVARFANREIYDFLETEGIKRARERIGHLLSLAV